MFMKSKGLVAAAALTVAASGAFAQTQEGLVNLSVDGNTVQVPVDVAANVCDLDVNVLSGQFVGSDETACEIDQATAAQNGIGTGQGNGGDRQEGLVNLSVDDNTIQVPIGIAANVCDVDANVLARQVKGSDESACTVDQETAAENGLDRFGDIGAPAGADADAAGDALDDAADAVEDTAEEAGDAVEDAAEDAGDAAEDAAEAAEETADEAGDTATN